MASKFNILLVEDDENLGFMLKDNMEMVGYQVRLCRDGKKGLTAFHNDDFHLCILDVMMPLKDGFSLAEDIRRYNRQIPIIFLTAKNQSKDRIRGFRIGADDYVPKPFSLEELLLRVEVLLKRVYNYETKADSKHLFSLGIFNFDFSNQMLSSGDHKIKLTNKEARLLKILVLHKDRVVERDVIMTSIWENEGYFVARSMDVFISRLRKHLSADPSISIKNIHGVGYRLSTI
jgi:DNA-binding response OmpR family regulator